MGKLGGVGKMGGSGEDGREWGSWEGVGKMGGSGEDGREWGGWEGVGKMGGSGEDGREWGSEGVGKKRRCIAPGKFEHNHPVQFIIFTPPLPKKNTCYMQLFKATNTRTTTSVLQMPDTEKILTR